MALIHPAAPASGQARLQEERSPELEGQGEQKHPRGHRACSRLAQALAAQPSALGTVTRTIVGLRPLPCPSCAALQDHASQQMVQVGLISTKPKPLAAPRASAGITRIR